MSGRPPTVARLDAAEADTWAAVVSASRVALKSLPEVAVTPRHVRVRGLPVSRLAGGSGRRELSRLLAEGGALWVSVHAELEASQPEVLLALANDPPIATVASVPLTVDRADELSETVDRLRGRLRELTSQRDEARRSLAGATSRAAATEDLLTAERERADELERRVEASRQDQAQAESRTAEAVARERRRAVGGRARLEQDLADARRELAEARRELAAIRATPTPSAPAAPFAEPGVRGLRPGRPSVLPDGVGRPSREAAELLVRRGHEVFVDGWNVSQRRRPHLDREGQRTWLVDALVAAASRRQVRFTVMFDATSMAGHPGSRSRQGGVVVVHPAADMTADDELVFAVAAAEPDEPITVVTDDRELRGRLLEYGVDLLSTAELAWLIGS